MIDNKIKKLLNIASQNIRGMTKISDLNLPIETNNISIFEDDKKIYFKLNNNKISYFFTQGEYVSNFKLLQRLLYCFGIYIKNDSLKNIEEMKKICKNLLEDRIC